MTKDVMTQNQLDVLGQAALLACCKAHQGGFQRLRDAQGRKLADALLHGLRGLLDLWLTLFEIAKRQDLRPRLWKAPRSPIADHVLTYIKGVCQLRHAALGLNCGF